MEPDKVATIAALAVALVALLVASAQAIQQYFVSGQLIRLCDSVVYNRMPGQGHRVWQFSQFRFRVVYSIPRIHLKPEIWPGTSMHIHSPLLDDAKLPNLSVKRSKSSSAALAGEASWVSFVRAVQYSAGQSLRYTMLDGDADRCPSDLPTVPMQLSMRDVIVVATMMGMECTDISFQSQSLSMQGDAGTITSSRHPVLGALIHFAPKQAFDNHGIQAQGGAINSDWVARMLDIITVAGQSFDLRDRKHFEEDEGSWIRANRDSSFLHSRQQVGIASSSPPNNLRRRRQPKQAASMLDQDNLSPKHRSTRSHNEPSSSRIGDTLVHQPQDGEWILISASTRVIKHDLADEKLLQQPAKEGLSTPASSENVLRTAKGYLHKLSLTPRFRYDNDVLPFSEPRTRVHEDDPGKESIDGELKVSRTKRVLDTLRPQNADKETPNSYASKTKQRATSHLSVESKRHTDPNDRAKLVLRHRHSGEASRGQQQLLLTNGAENMAHADTEVKSPGLSTATLRNAGSKARAGFMVEKWERTFQKRQKERSRGRSRSDRERQLVLRQRSAQSTRRKSQSGSRLEQNGKRLSRNSRLAIDKPQPHKKPERLPNITTRDMKSHSRGNQQILEGRGHPQRKATNHEMKITNSTSSDSSSSSLDRVDFAAIKKRKSVHTDETEPRRGKMIDRQSSLGDFGFTRRGRRRNSSLAREAISSLEGSHSPYRDFAALQDDYGRRKPQSKERKRSMSRGKKRVVVLVPEDDVEAFRSRSRPDNVRTSERAKSALRSPTDRFPEDPHFIRPGVAPAEACRGDNEIPQNARWTKLKRRLVSPEALERGRERFEEKDDCLIVLRVLTRDEVEQYAIETQVIREMRARIFDRESVTAEDGYSSDSSFERLRPQDQDHESSRSSSSWEQQNMTQTGQRGGSALHYHTYNDLQTPMNRPSLNNGDSEYSVGQSDNDTPLQATENCSMDDLEEEHATCASQKLASEEGSLVAESNDIEGKSEDLPKSPRRQSLLPRRITTYDEGILTYDEEVLFLNSDNILKKLKACTEECKDVITTLQFVGSQQTELESQVGKVCDCVKDCNTSLKALLMILEPLHTNKKFANVVVTDLSVLQWSLQMCLERLQHEFNLLDITLMAPAARAQTWKHTVNGFEEEFGCTMIESLTLAHNFCTEVALNFKIGTFRSPESAMAKKYLARASGYDRVAPAAPSPVQEISPLSATHDFHASSFLHSPSRFVRSPSRSSFSGFDVEQSPPFGRNHNRFTDSRLKQPTSANDDFRGGLIYKEPSEQSSDDEADSSVTTLMGSSMDSTGEVNWFWLSQADVLPGFFATPWKTNFTSITCLGAISVLHKALEGYTNKSNLRYVPSHDYSKQWLHSGRTTYPSYAHNANGGVVVAGTFQSTIFDALGIAVAPLELLNSHEHQVDRNYFISTQTVIEDIAEIMGLDSWLSICGRLTEIINGSGRLLQTLPTLVQQIMTDFDLEFSTVDRASRDGGLRIIKTISGSLLQYLKEQNLSAAEQLFSLVGLLRTAKMALCVSRGTDTAKLRDVLVHDVQVYLA